jgi:hypothetical protein
MRTKAVLITVCAAALALSGCDQIKKMMGAAKPASGQASAPSSSAPPSSAAAPASSEASASNTAAAGTGQEPEGVDPDSLKRKPGLWEMSETLDDAGVAKVSQICVDEASEATLSVLGSNVSKELCQHSDMARQADGSLHITATCDMGATGTVVTNGVMTGNFNNQYTARTDTTTTGATMKKLNGHHTMVIEAKWTGPCAPDQKGGDMIMPGGRKINVTTTLDRLRAHREERAAKAAAQ